MTLSAVRRHSKIVGALMMRETITRFGREGLGFLWVIGEPLLFCLFVLGMWSLLKPDYEHGVRLGPFVMTGYMSLLLLRHQIGFSMYALQGNIGLLHHRQISVLHLFLARNTLEFAGGTAAFVVVYVILLALGQVGPPKDALLLYSGWFLLGLMGNGIAIIMAALAMRSDLMERLVPVLTYALIPVSGAFFMVGWLPDRFRDPFLLVPFPNAIEMIRAGVFGEFVATYYHPIYAIACAGVMNFLGLVLLASSKDLVEVE
jgi:capsular polysaccharide transport system permease protein